MSLLVIIYCLLLSLSESHTDTNMNPYNINIRVFGTKVGAGKGIDFGQAGCGAVPSTCHTWGFGVNTGGLCDSSRIGDGTFDPDRNSDRSLPYQRSYGITYSMKADGMSTKLFR